MNDVGSAPSRDAAPGAVGRRHSILTQIRLAAGFLTIFPLVDSHGNTPQEVSASLGWFPLVGFAIGGALAAEAYLLGFVCGDAIRAAAIVMTLAMVTGAVHLDGLADTADALGAGRDRKRALEILRDSRIGTFGASALFFVLALKVLAIAATAGKLRYAALWLAPGVARWTMVALAYRLDYLRADGAGTTLLARDGRRNFILASSITIAGALPLFGYHSLRASITTIAITLALGVFYRKWLGGLTGDLIGAAGEIVETAALLAMST
jgi:adenosylcobinamide-GDP ribazoletransferase